MIPLPERADPALRRASCVVRPEPDRAPHRAALELLDRGRRGDASATRSARSSPTASAPGAGGRSSSATGATSSSATMTSSWPTRFFARWGKTTVFIGAAAAGRAHVHQLPGGRGAHAAGAVHRVLQLAGALPVEHAAGAGSASSSAPTGRRSRRALQPFDTLMLVVGVGAVILFTVVADGHDRSSTQAPGPATARARLGRAPRRSPARRAAGGVR